MLDRFMRLPEVENITGLKKSAIWKWINEGNFPKGIQLSKKTTVWRESAIKEWQDSFDKLTEAVGVQENTTIFKTVNSRARRRSARKSEA